MFRLPQHEIKYCIREDCIIFQCLSIFLTDVMFSLSPSKAVDGNYDTDILNCQCFHCNDCAGGPNWMSVDMGGPYHVDSVVVLSRSNERL